MELMRLLSVLLFVMGSLVAGALPSTEVIDYINNYKKDRYG